MKKLQERLKAGIDFNPKKDPCYDSIVEEAETILEHKHLAELKLSEQSTVR